MVPDEPSRRDVLQTGAALSGLATLGSLAGCTGQQNPENDEDSTEDGDGEETPDTGDSPLHRVPESADAAAHGDAEAVLDDRGTERVVNAMLEMQAKKSWYSGPETYEALLSRFSDDFGLDVDGIETVTPFWAWGSSDSYNTVSQEFAGWLFRADWAENDLIQSIEQANTEYEETEHAGQPVYEPDYEYSYWVGVVGDGEYVLGSEDAVKDAIDVQHADEDPMDEDLRAAYETTRTGPARFVGTIPTDHLPDKAGPNDEFDLAILDDIDVVVGAVYVNGDNRGIETTFVAADEATADDAAAMLDGLVTAASDQVGNDAFAEALGSVEVSQDGSTVLVSYEASIATLVDLVEESMGTNSSGHDDGDLARRAPQASFSFDYEKAKEDRGTLTITHEGGDTIDQSELYIRGDGFATVPSVDMRTSGQWAGSTSSTQNGEPAVVAGDRVTIGAESDYDLNVVWESEDGDSSATLAADDGPARS